MEIRMTLSLKKPQICLIDGTSLYFAVKDEIRKLNYVALVSLLQTNLGINDFVFWTWYSKENQGQMRFIKFLEEELKFKLELYQCSSSKDSDKTFEIEIANALGRLKNDAYVLSDSKALVKFSKGSIFFSEFCSHKLVLDLSEFNTQLFGEESKKYTKNHSLF
jgi:hypothetical protein